MNICRLALKTFRLEEVESSEEEDEKKKGSKDIRSQVCNALRLAHLQNYEILKIKFEVAHAHT